MRRHFSAVHLEGTLPEGPVILAVTHSAWWDSMMIFDLCVKTLGRDAYALMDAGNLRKLPFLGWIGGFGVERGDREDGTRALEYAAALLARSAVITMFPQGRERPLSARPLGIRPGVARLSVLAPAAAVVPVVLRYEHAADERPVALVSIGERVPMPTSDGIEEAMLAQLERVELAWCNGSWKKWPLHVRGRGTRYRGDEV